MTLVRAAAHVHSEWSYDATWPLKQLAGSFARRGYDVMLTAEHDRGFDAQRWDDYRRACADASDERILIVPGMEYEDADSVVHIPVWGEDLPFFGAGQPTLDLLRQASEREAFTVFAHPSRRNAMSLYRPEWAELLAAVEIWNRHYDGIAPFPPGRRFAEDEGLLPFVSLDFHTRRQFFPLAMVLDVEGPVTPSSVIGALRAGRCRPELLRVSALHLTRGLPGASARGAESLRRVLRGPLRKLERSIRR